MKQKYIYILALILTLTVILTGCSKKKSDTISETESDKASSMMTSSTEEIDAMTSASIVDSAEDFIKAVSQDGNWIIAVTQDITTDKDVVVEGQFTSRDEIYRKIALYDQDDDHNVTARYFLRAPTLTIKSENTRLQGGTFVGDVYVEANKFHIYDGTVDGSIYFDTEENKSTFELQEGGVVTGELLLK